MSRPRCVRCELPLRSCLCACVRSVPHRTAVRVLQHPAEAAHAKNSLRLLRLCLQDCQVLVAETLPPQAFGQAALLYPGGEQVTRPPDTLWVLDGSWRQSRSLLRGNPALAALPRVSLKPNTPPLYAGLRKAHRPQQHSTLEAVAAALAQLENDAQIALHLREAMQAWLALQREFLPAA